jgi:hypothetical protein
LITLVQARLLIYSWKEEYTPHLELPIPVKGKDAWIIQKKSNLRTLVPGLMLKTLLE